MKTKPIDHVLNVLANVILVKVLMLVKLVPVSENYIKILNVNVQLVCTKILTIKLLPIMLMLITVPIKSVLMMDLVLYVIINVELVLLKVFVIPVLMKEEKLKEIAPVHMVYMMLLHLLTVWNVVIDVSLVQVLMNVLSVPLVELILQSVVVN
jgi:hypothetical protein